MRTFLAVVGAIALAIIGLFVILVVRAAVTLGPLVKDASAYVDKAVPAIAAKWDRDELIKRGTPALRASATPEAMAPIFAIVKPFGAMTKYNGSNCAVLETAATQSGRQIVANCVATANFERGTVNFQIGLLKQPQDWAINGFFVQGIAAPDHAPVVSFGFGMSESTHGFEGMINKLGSLVRSKWQQTTLKPSPGQN